MRNILFCIVTACLLAGCTAPQTKYAPLPQAVARPSTANEVPAVIFVTGEFRSPGVYAWTNGMTLRDGVIGAGGFTPLALHWIEVDHPDGTSQSYKLRAGAIAENPALRAGDKITCFKR